MPVAYNPRDPDVIANPFPALKALREREPIHWREGLGGRVVTRYADRCIVRLDGRLSMARMRVFFKHLPAERRDRVKQLKWSIGLWLVFHDPPDHSLPRGLLNRGFTSRAIVRMEARVAAIVDQLIDRISDRDAVVGVPTVRCYRLPTEKMRPMGCHD